MWATAAVCAAALVLGVASEAVAFDWDQPTRWVPDLLTGWALVGSGLVAWRSRRAPAVGGLLITSGFTWFMGGIWPGAMFWHRGPLVHVLVTYPGWRPRARVDAVALAIGYVAAIVPGAWGRDPFAVVLLAGLLVVVGHGYAVSLPRDRSGRRIALDATVPLIVVLLGGAIARAVAPDRDAVLPSLLAYEVVLMGVAGMLVVRLPRPSPEEIADLVVELDDRASGDLRSRLARTLGDPGLQVGFWSPAVDAYLAEDGTPLAPPEPGSLRHALTVERHGQPFAMLILEAQAGADPRLVEAVTGAADLVSTQLALRDAVDEQVRQIAESRRRLLITGDEERARLAARVARGPQRRLREIAGALEGLPTGPAGGATERALEHARVAQQDLTALSAGLHPRELEESGLARALERVAARSPLPVQVDAHVPAVAEPVEVAAYYVACEALANVAKHARAGSARVRAALEQEALVIEVTDDGSGGADPAGSGITGLSDRVAALGGSLEVASPVGAGTLVRARIPLRAEPA